ncbi:MAG: response regulator [Elusimicrobiota bacterium]
MAGKKRILIADDDPELLGLLKFYLGKQGYETITAENGTQALAKAQEEKPDLVLMDVMMPEIDGYHVAQALTERLGPSCPKIILMTSRDTQREQGVALLSGAAATLQKPVKLADVKAKVAEFLPPEA